METGKTETRKGAGKNDGASNWGLPSEIASGDTEEARLADWRAKAAARDSAESEFRNTLSSGYKNISTELGTRPNVWLLGLSNVLIDRSIERLLVCRLRASQGPDFYRLGVKLFSSINDSEWMPEEAELSEGHPVLNGFRRWSFRALVIGEADIIEGLVIPASVEQLCDLLLDDADRACSRGHDELKERLGKKAPQQSEVIVLADKLRDAVNKMREISLANPIVPLSLILTAMEVARAQEDLNSVSLVRRITEKTLAQEVIEAERSVKRKKNLDKKKQEAREKSRKPTIEKAREIIKTHGNRNISLGELQTRLAEDGYDHDLKTLRKWVVDLEPLMVERGGRQQGYRPNPALFS
jgi:hypothetical protein